MVFSQANPGAKRFPKAALREFVHQALDTTILREKAAKSPDELT
jgi:hypothetical protein